MGSPWANGEVCREGECTLHCKSGLSACDDTCRDLLTDRAHCRACDVRCGPNILRDDQGDLSDGRSCQDSTCQCVEGAPGERCEIFECGDGRALIGEACDDGNLDADDGCSTLTTAETGFRCENHPSQYTAMMGDGLIRGDEVRR